MANMSYCKFENTYSDLRDCYETLSEKDLDDLSKSEKKYAEYLINLCAKIADNFSNNEN